MSDNEPDLELLDLLRKSLGLDTQSSTAVPETKVLESARFICDNSVDVAIDMRSTKVAAREIWQQMQKKSFSTQTWSEHELHPKSKDESTVNFIFTMDLLNFSFWSEKNGEQRFGIEYKEKKWVGYWSLVAALQRALDEGVHITTPSFWNSDECTTEIIQNIFRSSTEEEIPLLAERVTCLKEAGKVLCETYNGSVIELIEKANNSAAALVNLLADEFACFRDESVFEGKKVRFLKRAQIFVADLWAAFDGKDYGEFEDIDKITMFADYRVPQILQLFGCLWYSPPLEACIRRNQLIEPGHSWEIQLRGCSIWSVEHIKQEIMKEHPGTNINAILIDFFLYDTMKEREASTDPGLPHHRTRSIWY